MMPTPNRAAAKQARLRTALTGEPHTAALAAITGHPDPLPDGAHFAHATRDGHDANNPSVQWVDTATCTPLGVPARDVRPITVPLMSGQQPYRPGDMLLEIAPTDDGDLWYARNVHNPRHLTNSTGPSTTGPSTTGPATAAHSMVLPDGFPASPDAWLAQARMGRIAFGVHADGSDAIIDLNDAPLLITGLVDADTATMVDTILGAVAALPDAYAGDLIGRGEWRTLERYGIDAHSTVPDKLALTLASVERDIAAREHARSHDDAPTSRVLRRVIVVDEFTRIITSDMPNQTRDTILASLDAIATRGPTLGVHLVLTDTHMALSAYPQSLLVACRRYHVGKLPTSRRRTERLLGWMPAPDDPTDPAGVHCQGPSGVALSARMVPIDNPAIEQAQHTGPHPTRWTRPGVDLGARIVLDFTSDDTGTLVQQWRAWAHARGRTFRHFSLTPGTPGIDDRATYDPFETVPAVHRSERFTDAMNGCLGDTGTYMCAAANYLHCGWAMALRTGLDQQRDTFTIISALLRGELFDRLLDAMDTQQAHSASDERLTAWAHTLRQTVSVDPVHRLSLDWLTSTIGHASDDPILAQWTTDGSPYAIHTTTALTHEDVCLFTLPLNPFDPYLDTMNTLLGNLALSGFLASYQRLEGDASRIASHTQVTIRGRQGTTTTLSLVDQRLRETHQLTDLIRA